MTKGATEDKVEKKIKQERVSFLKGRRRFSSEEDKFQQSRIARKKNERVPAEQEQKQSDKSGKSLRDDSSDRVTFLQNRRRLSAEQDKFRQSREDRNVVATHQSNRIGTGKNVKGKIRGRGRMGSAGTAVAVHEGVTDLEMADDSNEEPSLPSDALTGSSSSKTRKRKIRSNRRSEKMKRKTIDDAVGPEMADDSSNEEPDVPSEQLRSKMKDDKKKEPKRSASSRDEEGRKTPTAAPVGLEIADDSIHEPDFPTDESEMQGNLNDGGSDEVITAEVAWAPAVDNDEETQQKSEKSEASSTTDEAERDDKLSLSEETIPSCYYRNRRLVIGLSIIALVVVAVAVAVPVALLGRGGDDDDDDGGGSEPPSNEYTPPPYPDLTFPPPSTSDLSWNILGSDIDGSSGGDRFGEAVALSYDGTIMAGGAPAHKGENGAVVGQARVFRFNGTSIEWELMGNEIVGTTGGDRAGDSVALSGVGDTVAVGSIEHTGPAGESSGQVRVFSYNSVNNTWDVLGDEITGTGAGDESGGAVALNMDGNRLIVGARRHRGNGLNSGEARIFEYNSSTFQWDILGQHLLGENVGDFFGSSVAISATGDRIAVGATHSDEGGGASGSVSVFDFHRGENRWVRVGAPIAGPAPNSNAGFAVAMSGNGLRVAVGAINHDGNGMNSGVVRVYENVGFDWVRLGQDLLGDGEDDRAGWSVSLSFDGNRVAVSSKHGVSGHVRIYECENNTWERVGDDLFGETTGDDAGSSISLSASGYRIAVGAQYNDGTDMSSGQVRVYEY